MATTPGVQDAPNGLTNKAAVGSSTNANTAPVAPQTVVTAPPPDQGE